MSPEDAIDQHLAFLDDEDDAQARREECQARHLEKLVHIANLAFFITRYNLQTGELISCVPTSPKP